MPTVTIIGAGPAGSTAALLLSRAGWSVKVIEQHPFPRQKVCGECLSHLGFQVLTRLDLAEQFLSLNPTQLTRTLLHAPDGTSADLPLPHPMYGLSRHQFDPLLLTQAQQAGANLLQPYRCESLIPLTIRNLQNNNIKIIESDWILLADGRGTLFSPRPPSTNDLGIKAHFLQVDAPSDAIQLFSLPRHYIGLAPIESSLFNLAYSIPQSLLRPSNGDLDSLFQSLLPQNPALFHQFRHARRVTDWLASPLPRFAVQSHWPPGILPIGNAAASLEPIGGEGMGLALRSAELAAHALLTSTTSSLPAAYRQLWRTRRPACRAGAILFSNPTLSSAAVTLLDSFPTFASPLLSLIGK